MSDRLGTEEKRLHTITRSCCNKKQEIRARYLERRASQKEVENVLISHHVDVLVLSMVKQLVPILQSHRSAIQHVIIHKFVLHFSRLGPQYIMVVSLPLFLCFHLLRVLSVDFYQPGRLVLSLGFVSFGLVLLCAASPTKTCWTVGFKACREALINRNQRLSLRSLVCVWDGNASEAVVGSESFMFKDRELFSYE